MREAADYALYSSISSVAGTAAVFITPIVISVSSSGSSAIITTVVGSSVLVASLLANQVFDYLEKASYQSLLKEYLKDLNDHIFSSSKTSSIYHQLDYKVRSLAEANRQVIW
jgi:K+-sensing histidine kinase KdpD